MAIFDGFRRQAMVAAAAVGLLIVLVACAPGAASPEACVEEGRELRLGFYAHFAPVSHSSDGEPSTAGFTVTLMAR